MSETRTQKSSYLKWYIISYHFISLCSIMKYIGWWCNKHLEKYAGSQWGWDYSYMRWTIQFMFETTNQSIYGLNHINIAMENPPIFKFSKPSIFYGPFSSIYTMAMLVITRGNMEHGSRSPRSSALFFPATWRHQLSHISWDWEDHSLNSLLGTWFL